MRTLLAVAVVASALLGTARASANPHHHTAESGKRAPTLSGQWKAAPLVDGDGKPVGDVPDLERQLDFADLPREGEIVQAKSGVLCIADQRCHDMGWSKTKIVALEGGHRFVEDLHLAPGATAFTGSTGSKRSLVILVPGSGGTLRALFGVCGPNASNCRNVWQPWQPLTPRAGFSQSR